MRAEDLTPQPIFDEVPRCGKGMHRQRRRTSLLFIVLLLVHVLSPAAFAQTPKEEPVNETDASLELLQQLNLAPSAQAQHGWIDTGQAASITHLLYRDVALVSPSEWTAETGQQQVEGFHILGHTSPVPSDCSTTCQGWHRLFLVHATGQFPLRRGVDDALRLGSA